MIFITIWLLFFMAGYTNLPVIYAVHIRELMGHVSFTNSMCASLRKEMMERFLWGHGKLPALHHHNCHSLCIRHFSMCWQLGWLRNLFFRTLECFSLFMGWFCGGNKITTQKLYVISPAFSAILKPAIIINTHEKVIIMML